MDSFSPRKPDIILWDWDNTLVDSWKILHNCLNATLLHMNRPTQSLEFTMRSAHKSLIDTFPEKFGNQWEDAKTFFYETFNKIHIENLQPLQGAVDTLQYCRDLGIISAVVSNKRHDLLCKEAAHLNWNSYLVENAIIGSGYADSDKPAAVHARIALQQFPIDTTAAHIWFVGDSASDLQCAVNIGAQAVLFGENHHINDDLLQAATPLIRARNHAQLQSYIAAL